jgi:hypothetical protein
MPGSATRIVRPEHRRKRVAARLESGYAGQPPNFIIIGAQKGGTTSLHRYLTQHPDVSGGLRKEVHFFSWTYEQGLDWYLAHFPPRGEARVVGEASTSYLCHPKVPARIRRDVPNAKLIALLRNPVDRAYSQYQMNVRKGFEALSFEDALEAEPQRLREAGDWATTQWRYSSYATRGLYAEQLAWWFAAFPREQLLVLKSEAFFAEPAAGIAQTLAFLGLDAWSPVQYEVHNPGSYSDMAPATRRRLAAYFAPHNQRLYELLDWDLGWDDA